MTINLSANREVFRRFLLFLERIAPRFPGLFFNPPFSPFSRWLDVFLGGFLVWYSVLIIGMLTWLLLR